VGADLEMRCVNGCGQAGAMGGLTTTAGDELSDDNVETAGDIAYAEAGV